MDPTDQWVVWDKARNLPAEHSGLVLIGLSRSVAWMHCQTLNKPPPPAGLDDVLGLQARNR